jgi:hypothetical protein
VLKLGVAKRSQPVGLGAAIAGLLVITVTGCAKNENASAPRASASPSPSSVVAAPLGKGSAEPSASMPIGPSANHAYDGSWREQYDDAIEAFQAALSSGNRRRVVDLTRDPLRVNARKCSHYLSPADLFARYDDVFTQEVHRAVVSSHAPFFANWQGASVADGRVWFESFDDEPVRAVAVNVDAWEIQGLPCGDRRIEPLPSSVEGSWRLSSVFALNAVERPLSAWKRAQGRSFEIRDGRFHTHWPTFADCTLDHYARLDAEDWIALRGTPYSLGLSGTYQDPRALILRCGGGRTTKQYWRAELWLLGGDRIAVANEPVLVFRKLERPSTSAVRELSEGQDCSGEGVRCAANLVCQAEQLREPLRLRERCSMRAER